MRANLRDASRLAGLWCALCACEDRTHATREPGPKAQAPSSHESSSHESSSHESSSHESSSHESERAAPAAARPGPPLTGAALASLRWAGLDAAPWEQVSDEEPAAQFTLCELDELEGATVVDHRDALRRRTDGLVGGFCHVLARAQPQGTLIEARRSSTPGHGERFMAVEVQGPRPLSVDLAHGKLAVADAQRVEVYDQRRGVSVWRASLAAGAPGQLMHVMWHPGHQLTVERLDDQGWWRQGFDGLTGKSLGQERLDKRVQDALRDPIGALQARLGEPEGSLIPAKGREHALIGASLDALTLRVPRGDSSCPGEFYEVRAQEATPQAASKPGALLCSDPKRLTRDSAAWVLGPDRALLIEVGVADTGPEPRLTKARVACAAVHLIELPSGRALGRWMERVKAR